MRAARSLCRGWLLGAMLALLVAAPVFADTIHESGRHIWPQAQMQLGPLRFQDLLLPCIAGTTAYCENCSPTNPCTGGGPGVHARCEGASAGWTCRDVGAGTGTVQTVDCTDGLLCTPDPITAAGIISLDIDQLTLETSLADGDLFPFLDVSAGTDPNDQRKVTLANLRQAINPSTTTTTTVATTTTTTATTTTVTTTTVATTTTTTLPIGFSIPFAEWWGIGEPVEFSTAPPQVIGLTLPAAGQGTGAQLHTANGFYIAYTSTAGATNTAGWVTGTNIRLGYNPLYDANIRTGADITAQRIWVGFSSSIAHAGGLGTDTPGTTNAQSGIAFRYSSAAPDTNWQIVSFNGTTETVADTGVLVAASTIYRFRIDALNPASVNCYINNVLTNTVTATLPATTTDLIGVQRLYNIGVVSRVISERRVTIIHQVL